MLLQVHSFPKCRAHSSRSDMSLSLCYNMGFTFPASVKELSWYLYKTPALTGCLALPCLNSFLNFHAPTMLAFCMSVKSTSCRCLAKLCWQLMMYLPFVCLADWTWGSISLDDCFFSRNSFSGMLSSDFLLSEELTFPHWDLQWVESCPHSKMQYSSLIILIYLTIMDVKFCLTQLVRAWANVTKFIVKIEHDLYINHFPQVFAPFWNFRSPPALFGFS